jgi:hypothetical protein
MGDIEGGDPPSSRRGFSLRGWLNPRERGRAAAAANTAPQGPELPLTHPFRKISAVPEERYVKVAACICNAATDVSTAALACCCCCCCPVCLGQLARLELQPSATEHAEFWSWSTMTCKGPASGQHREGMQVQPLSLLSCKLGQVLPGQQCMVV